MYLQNVLVSWWDTLEGGKFDKILIVCQINFWCAKMNAWHEMGCKCWTTTIILLKQLFVHLPKFCPSNFTRCTILDVCEIALLPHLEFRICWVLQWGSNGPLDRKIVVNWWYLYKYMYVPTVWNSFNACHSCIATNSHMTWSLNKGKAEKGWVGVRTVAEGGQIMGVVCNHLYLQCHCPYPCQIPYCSNASNSCAFKGLGLLANNGFPSFGHFCHKYISTGPIAVLIMASHPPQHKIGNKVKITVSFGCS